MKIKSWPKPPLDFKEVPEIPTEFKIFGIEYTVEDSEISPKDIPREKFSKEKILGLVKESYCKYLDILQEFKEENLEEINQIHLRINEELNKMKEVEVEFELKRLKNEKNRRINKMIEELENEMNNPL